MTVQEFFNQLNKKEFVEYYLDYAKDHVSKNRKARKIINKFLDEIHDYSVKKDENKIIFSLKSINSTQLDSFFAKKSDFDKEEIEHYAYDFENVSDVIGYSISNACRYYIGNDYQYAASILYEMSFFGYTIKHQEDTVEEERNSLKEAVDDIEKQGETSLISFDELCKNLGFEYKDTRTEEEKQFDLSIIKNRIDNSTEVFKLLVELEKSYYFSKN